MLEGRSQTVRKNVDERNHFVTAKYFAETSRVRVVRC